MNNDLIKELEVLLDYYRGCPTGSLFTILTKCKAEIERLNGKALSLQYELDCLNESGAGTVEQLQKRIAEIARYNEQRGVK